MSTGKKAKSKSGMVPTAKQIEDEHQLAKSCADSAVEHAIRCGQMLITKKDEIGHRNWTAWVENNCSFALRTAQLYMKAVAKSEGLASIRHLFPSSNPLNSKKKVVSKAQRVALLPATDTSTAAKAGTTASEISDIGTQAPQGQLSAARRGETTTPIGETKARKADTKAAGREPNPVVIETKPAKPPIDDDRWEPDHDEDATLELAEKEIAASIDRVMQSDDRLAAAHAEIKRQAAKIAELERSRNGFMEGKNALNNMLKKEQRKVDDLKKKLQRAESELEKLRERIVIMETA